MDLPAAATELDRATTVADLLPVSAEAADAVGRRLRSMGATLDAVHREIEALESVPEWLGDAGRTFEQRVQRLPDRTRHGAEVFHTAGRTFSALARAVADARPEVIAAFDLWQQSERRSQRWRIEKAAHPDEHPAGLPLHDPGEPTAHRAIAIYAAARRQMSDATERAMTTLTLASQAAPDIRTLLEAEGPVASMKGLARGVGDFVHESVDFAHDFSSVRALVDPDGYRADLRGVHAGLSHLLRHPGDLDDVLFDLELLRDDPIRWLGKVVAPTILLAPLSKSAQVGDGSTRAGAQLGRSGGVAAGSVDDLGRVAAALGLPSPGSLSRLADPMFLQQVIDSARHIDPDADDDVGAYADIHGGRPQDYERKVATVSLEEGRDLTFTFVHNTATGEVFDPKVLGGEAPESCTDS